MSFQYFWYDVLDMFPILLGAACLFGIFAILVHIGSESLKEQAVAEAAFAKSAKTIHLIKTHEGWVYSYKGVRGGILPPFVGSFFSAFAEMMEDKGIKKPQEGEFGAGDQFFEDMGWNTRGRKAPRRERED